MTRRAEGDRRSKERPARPRRRIERIERHEREVRQERRESLYHLPALVLVNGEWKEV